MYKRFSYAIDRYNKTLTIAREHDTPAVEPVREAVAEHPSPPGSYMRAVQTPSTGSTVPAVTGPFQTITSVWYRSTTTEPLVSPPARNDEHPFKPGVIWVNDITGARPGRQAFVFSVQGDWSEVPGALFESGKASFPHPQQADKWLAFSDNGQPKWLKAATLEKRRREQAKLLGSPPMGVRFDPISRSTDTAGSSTRRPGTPRMIRAGPATPNEAAVAE
ncbi:hypothetical protein V5O48_016302 [Marasmius crinis-equi]|uniref:Uncharacterized protein n=1 Tax=Marasmius crinis-equi TaxID=585013 RepID=A0ABR3ES63_9AGAR